MSKATVMLVEDESNMRKCLALMLANVGYTPVVAASGDEAMAMLDLAVSENQAVDLLVTDISMPHMSGLDLIDELRRRKIFMPIIAITGMPISSLPEKASDVIYMEKPFDMDLFICNVEKAIKSARRNDNPRQRQILLVEDDLKTMKEVSDLLNSSNHLVVEALCEDEAEGWIDLAEKKTVKFDLVIIDTQRSSKVGSNLIRKARALSWAFPTLVLDSAPDVDLVHQNNISPVETKFDGELFLHFVNGFFKESSSPDVRSSVQIPWQFFERRNVDQGMVGINRRRSGSLLDN